MFIMACGGRAPMGGNPTLRTVDVTCRGHVVHAEVADDEATRERGLMFRKKLEPDVGMLFVFAQAEETSFWMKDTYIPLSIAFLDDDGRIANLDDMEPFDSQTMHRSAGRVRYALEVNRGWFALHDIGPGDSCDLRGATAR